MAFDHTISHDEKHKDLNKNSVVRHDVVSPSVVISAVLSVSQNEEFFAKNGNLFGDL